MKVVERGGPLLMGRSSSGHFYPLGVHDNDGIYIYIPGLSRLFGVRDPLRMMRFFYVALALITTAIYPFIFYRLTLSLVAALAAPLMFIICLLSMGWVDSYWVPAWGALTLLPIAFLLARDWPRYGLALAAGVAFVASWLSSIRGYSGLGIMIGLGIALLVRRWRWWRLLPTLAMLACIYVSISTVVVNAVTAERNHRLGAAANALRQQAPQTLWHTAYAGLGYLPNKYGLRYSDHTPAAAVQREAPGTGFQSRRYETIIREAYLHFAVEHPLEMVRQYTAKAIVVVADIAPYLVFVLMTLPAMLLWAPDRHAMRLWYVITTPAVAMAFLPIMLAVPLEDYEQGLYGVLGVMTIVSLCWVLSLEVAAGKTRDIWARFGGRRSSWAAIARAVSPGWRSARISAVALLVLVAISIGGYFLRQDAGHWLGGRYGVLMEKL